VENAVLRQGSCPPMACFASAEPAASYEPHSLRIALRLDERSASVLILPPLWELSVGEKQLALALLVDHSHRPANPLDFRYRFSLTRLFHANYHPTTFRRHNSGDRWDQRPHRRW